VLQSIAMLSGKWRKTKERETNDRDRFFIAEIDVYIVQYTWSPKGATLRQ
jgi:hypothetical protein